MRARALTTLAAPALTLGITLVAVPHLTVAALKSAAGGGPNGNNGFTQFTAFLNTLGTDLIYVGAAGGVIGLVASGGMLMSGSPQANGFLTKVVIGLGVILMAKGVFA